MYKYYFLKIVTVFITSLLFSFSANSQEIKDIHGVDFNNFTYNSNWGGKIKLKNGKDKDSNSSIVLKKYADLDGDGQDEAVIVIGISTGGTIAYVEELHIFSYKAGQIKEEYFDSREKPDETVVSSKSVVISYPVWKEEDAHCCPSITESKIVKFEDGEYVAKTHQVPYKEVVSKVNKTIEVTDDDKDNVGKVIAGYFQFIQDKQSGNAINCFISSKRSKIRPVIEKIISETDYYKNLSVESYAQNENKLIAKVSIDQKRYEDPDIEHWNVTIEFIKSGSEWKIFKVY